MKIFINYIVVFIILLTICFPLNVLARPGCCSWHGGESGCSGNRTVCADGTISSCPCDGTSSSSSYSSSSSSYNSSDSENGNSTIIVWVILIGGFIAFAYISDWREKAKKEKMKREKEAKELAQKRAEEQKVANIQNFKDGIINGENITLLLGNIDKESLERITSDDIIEIINYNVLTHTQIIFLLKTLFEVNGDNMFFGNIMEDNIFNNICVKLVNKKLSDSSKIVIECIWKYTCDDYSDIFLKLLKKGEIDFLTSLFHKRLKCKFEFNDEETLQLFNVMCDINNLDFVNLVVQKRYFTYNLKYMYSNVFNKIIEERDYSKLKLYCLLFYKNVYYDVYSVNYAFDLLIKRRDIKCVKYYLETCEDINTFLREYGAKFIYLSIKRLWIDNVEYVLGNYKDVINLDVRIDGGTPLTYACYKRSYRMVKALIDYGVDVDYRDVDNYSALMYACDSRNLKICKLLVEHGAFLENEYYSQELEKAITKRDPYRLPNIYIYSVYSRKKKK